MSAFIDLTGQRFSMLVVIKKLGYDRHKKNIYWLCQCDCGNQKEIIGTSLRSGNTTSCGCRVGLREKCNRWKGYGEIAHKYFYSTKQSAERRNIKFDVTIEYMWELFLKQNRKCALTGEILTFPTSCKTYGTASLDRIDSNKGYEEGNVHWVHKTVNIMKWSLSKEEFVNFCRKVVQYEDACTKF